MMIRTYLLAAALAALTAACESAPSGEPAATASPSETTATSGALVPNEAPSADTMEKPMNDPLAAPADVAAPPADAERTASGLATKVIKPAPGAGQKPSATDTVTVHYTGWTTDGAMFDSSVKHGEPTSFPLNRVIPGWSETVMLMVPGETRRAWIPEDLAYKGQAGAPQGMLVFDIELISVD